MNNGTYSLGVATPICAEYNGRVSYCLDCYGSFSFSMSKNTEIPLSYEEGVLVNFPIGTKECSWSGGGAAYRSMF